MKYMNSIKLKNIIVVITIIAASLLLMVIKLPCPFYTLTGFLCIGCGMTRAVASILSFNFISALNYNPVCLIVPFILFMILFDGKPFKREAINRTLFFMIVLSTVIAYTLHIII